MKADSSNTLKSIGILTVLLTAAALTLSLKSQAVNTEAAVKTEASKPIQSRRKRISTGKHKPCEHCSPKGNQFIYIPLIELPEAEGGEIVFNSRSPQTIDVTPVFYKRNGDMVVGDPVPIKSAEMRYVNVLDLLPAHYKNENDWGGFGLSYFGTNREMWSQFRFVGVNRQGSIDEFFTVREESRALSYDAAFWSPDNSEAVIALGNISASPSGATVTLPNGTVRHLRLQPHATDLIREPLPKSGAESVHITVEGSAGSIIPAGMITSKKSSFNSVIRFYDPTAAKQSSLFANGLHLTKTRPHMILENTTSVSMIVMPKFSPISGETEAFNLSPVWLAPNETKEVDLTSLLRAAEARNDLNIVSVTVANPSGPGSIIGSIYATDNQTGLSYDVPLRDSGTIRTMTGAYPWKIADDYRTVTYLTNISSKQRQFVAELAYEGGKFTFTPRTLEPGETAIFDLEEIRNSQQKDDSGRTLPLTASVGQFKWAIRGPTDGQIVMIGRAEMVNASAGISSSYSCPTDCGPSYQGTIDYPSELANGTSDTGTATETAYFNSGYQVGPYSASPSWSVDNSIASFAPTPASSTTITGTSPGSANVYALFGTQEAYGWDGLNCFYAGPYYEDAGGPMDVIGPPHHVYVIVDQAGFPLECPTTGVYLRQMQMQVVDINDKNVIGPYSIAESYSNLSANSCGNGAPIPTDCKPLDAGGTFLDSMAVAGGGGNPHDLCTSGISQASGCGATLTSTWRVCGGGPTNAIWTSTRETRSNSARVNGQFSTYAPGTYLYP